jgi:hypothetical protein
MDGPSLKEILTTDGPSLNISNRPHRVRASCIAKQFQHHALAPHKKNSIGAGPSLLKTFHHTCPSLLRSFNHARPCSLLRTFHHLAFRTSPPGQVSAPHRRGLSSTSPTRSLSTGRRLAFPSKISGH